MTFSVLIGSASAAAAARSIFSACRSSRSARSCRSRPSAVKLNDPVVRLNSFRPSASPCLGFSALSGSIPFRIEGLRGECLFLHILL